MQALKQNGEICHSIRHLIDYNFVWSLGVYKRLYSALVSKKFVPIQFYVYILSEQLDD